MMRPGFALALIFAASIGLFARPADANCALPGNRITNVLVDAWTRTPANIIKGEAVSDQDHRDYSLLIAKFAMSSPEALAALISVAPKASLSRRSDIGSGLHLAVSTCRYVGSIATARILAAMRSMSDHTVAAAYVQADALESSDALPPPDAGSSASSFADTLPSLGDAETFSRQSPANQNAAARNPFNAIEIEDPFRPVELTDPFAKQ